MSAAEARRVTAFLFFFFLLLCLCAATTVAQQTSPGLPTQNAGQPDQQAASAEKSSAESSQPNGDAKPHFSPGLRSHELQEGEKLPQRKEPDYEPWSGPELPPGMTMDHAIPMGLSKGDGFSRELWGVQWRELDPIDIWIIKPLYVRKPAVILYLYSYNSNNARYKDDEFCKFLTRNGVAAVGFVSAVTGQRFHDRPQRQTFVSELPEALATSAHDVQMVLNFLQRRGDVDMNRLGMWADGSGASIAILAAAVDERIKALDLLDPWGDWPEWLAKTTLVEEDQRPYYLSPYFQGLVANLDPLQWFPKLKTPKVRLQYIQDGITVTPAIAREKIIAAAPPNAENVHYDSREKFISEVAAKGRGFDWIKQTVQAFSQSRSEEQSRAKASLGSKDSQSQ
jgi:hypothetical protein